MTLPRLYNTIVMSLFENASVVDAANESTSCYGEYDTTQFKVVAAVRAAVGIFSFCCCLVVIITITVYKRYRFFTQRLVLYLTVVAMVHAFSYALARVNYYSTRPIEDPYCYFGGLLNHYTAAVELLNIWVITVNLFVNVVFRRRTEKLELSYFLVSYFLPLLWFWVPLWKKAYGTAGAWCGIRTVDKDCNAFPFGRWVQFGIWYIPLYTSLIIIFIASVVISMKAVRDSQRWEGRYDPHAKQRRKQVKSEAKYLIWYPVVYLLLNTFSLISQIYSAVHPDDPVVALWYLRVFTSPLRGAFIALVYTISSETRRQFRPSHFKAACLSCCRDDAVQEYDALYEEFTDSVRTDTYNGGKMLKEN